jgi:2-amino-4-hydroxy-6-hydroxymethyldihydropteridine diphosphokinase
VSVTAFIALGSNLDNPVSQVNTAIGEIEHIHGIELKAVSRLYRTAPVGPQDQDDFINAVVKVETTFPPLELLDRLQEIEQKHHRIRTVHWGPRTLDLDILLYGSEVIDSPRLKIPHPEMKRRGFVLVPLMDIASELVLPDGSPVSELVARLGPDDLKIRPAVL